MANMNTGSGLVDDYVFDIKDARFFHDARFGDGEITLIELTGINSETGGEDKIWMKAGKTWVIKGDGAYIEYEGSSRKPAVNRNTQYGHFIDSFMKCDGAEDIVTEKDMDAFVAESWVGLSLAIHRGVKEYNIDGEKFEGQIFEVEGIEGLVIPDAAPAAPDVDIPAAANAKLVKLAASSKTFEAFVDAAYDQVTGLTGAAYEDHVTDDGDSGFYALNRG